MDAGLLEANPAHQAANEPISFFQILEGFDHTSTHKAEIAHINWDVEFYDTTQQPVKGSSGKQFHLALAIPFGAHTIHDLKAFPPFCHELWDNLGGILKVPVDYHHRIAFCQFHPGSNGDLMSKITRKFDDFRIAIALGESY